MLSSALSDFISAGNAVIGRTKPTALLSANDALAVRKFNSYALYCLKPDDSGTGYAAPDPNPPFDDAGPIPWPGPKAGRISDASDAQTSAVPVTRFLRWRTDPWPMNADVVSLVNTMDEHSLTAITIAHGRWLAIGAVIGIQSDVDPHPGAPIVAIEYLSPQPVEDQAGGYLRGLLTSSMATVVIGALLAWFVAGRVQRPVSAASKAARELGAGDLTVRLPVTGHDEFSDLSGSFNQMADRLAETIDQPTRHDARQRQFVADVSHELRTPTASLLAAATALDNPATRDSAAPLITPQLRRLATLTENLLEISRMDSGEAALTLEPVDLAGLVADVVAHSQAPESVTVHAEGDTTADIDPRRMHTVINNLLSNALRHGAAPVTVTVSRTPTSLTVRVSDSGLGVPEDLRERIFDRFVQADTARSGNAGSGLGLAIARENARLHHATLTVENDHGAVFTLNIPGQ